MEESNVNNLNGIPNFGEGMPVGETVEIPAETVEAPVEAEEAEGEAVEESSEETA